MPESLTFPIKNGLGVSNDRFGFKRATREFSLDRESLMAHALAWILLLENSIRAALVMAYQERRGKAWKRESDVKPLPFCRSNPSRSPYPS